MSRLARLIAAMFLLVAVPARAQVEGVFTIPEFKFEGGGDMQAVKVGYVTWGKLNDRKDECYPSAPRDQCPEGLACLPYRSGQDVQFRQVLHYWRGPDWQRDLVPTQGRAGPQIPGVYNP